MLPEYLADGIDASIVARVWAASGVHASGLSRTAGQQPRLLACRFAVVGAAAASPAILLALGAALHCRGEAAAVERMGHRLDQPGAVHLNPEAFQRHFAIGVEAGVAGHLQADPHLAGFQRLQPALGCLLCLGLVAEQLLFLEHRQRALLAVGFYLLQVGGAIQVFRFHLAIGATVLECGPPAADLPRLKRECASAFAAWGDDQIAVCWLDRGLVLFRQAGEEALVAFVGLVFMLDGNAAQVALDDWIEPVALGDFADHIAQRLFVPCLGALLLHQLRRRLRSSGLDHQAARPIG